VNTEQDYNIIKTLQSIAVAQTTIGGLIM